MCCVIQQNVSRLPKWHALMTELTRFSVKKMSGFFVIKRCSFFGVRPKQFFYTKKLML